LAAKLQKQSVFDKLVLIAQDLLPAPALQGYVKRILAASGLLSSGKIKCMLEMRTLDESEQWFGKRHWVSVILYRV